MGLRVVVNASPLIFLAKAGLLEILRKLFDFVFTTQGIVEQVEKPLKLGVEAPEVSLIKKAEWIRVVELSSEERNKALNLSEELGVEIGEAEAAILFLRGRFDILAVADVEAERRLKRVGVNTKDLSDILYLAAQRRIVDLGNAAKRIWDAGYRTERIRRMFMF